MRTATGLCLIALGAILAFAVNGHPSFLNIQVVGWVVMLTGLAGMLVPRSGYAAVRRRIVRRRTGPGGPVTEVDERRYPPYIKLNPNAVVTDDFDDPGDLVSSSAEERAARRETVEETFDT